MTILHQHSERTDSFNIVAKTTDKQGYANSVTMTVTMVDIGPRESEYTRLGDLYSDFNNKYEGVCRTLSTTTPLLDWYNKSRIPIAEHNLKLARESLAKERKPRNIIKGN